MINNKFFRLSCYFCACRSYMYSVWICRHYACCGCVVHIKSRVHFKFFLHMITTLCFDTVPSVKLGTYEFSYTSQPASPGKITNVFLSWAGIILICSHCQHFTWVLEIELCPLALAEWFILTHLSVKHCCHVISTTEYHPCLW